MVELGQSKVEGIVYFFSNGCGQMVVPSSHQGILWNLRDSTTTMQQYTQWITLVNSFFLLSHSTFLEKSLVISFQTQLLVRLILPPLIC